MSILQCHDNCLVIWHVSFTSFHTCMSHMDSARGASFAAKVQALWYRCRVIFHTPSHPGYITSFLKYLEQLHECSVCEWFLHALLSENSYCGELSKSSTKVIIHLTFTSTLALTLFLVTRHSHLFAASELDIPFCSCITHKVLRTSTSS
jgi:hypothetical protein